MSGYGYYVNQAIIPLLGLAWVYSSLMLGRMFSRPKGKRHVHG